MSLLKPVPKKSSSPLLRALKIAAIYALFGLLWILFSDQVLLLMTHDAELLNHLQTMKGWLYVIVTAILLYLLVYQALADQRRIEDSLRLSEGRFRAIFDGVNDAIFLHDFTTGELRDLNAKAAEMYGYDREEILRTSLSELSDNQPPYTLNEASQWLEKARQGEEPTFEWRARHRSGRTFWVEVNMSKAELGEEPVILVAVRDIENRKQAEKMEALGVMAGGIAHDFNNLLSIILGNIEVIRHRLAEKKDIDKNLERVRSAAVRAADLTKQILTFSRKRQKDLHPVNPVAVIHESLKMLRSTLPTSVEIDCQIEASLEECTIKADETQLQQILFNLCTNAVHAMDEQGRLSVRLASRPADALDLPDRLRQPATDYLQLSVSDTGRGMSKEVLDKIFDPFFTTKTQGKGTGMGLAVVHGIVINHDGFITVDSQPGHGTSFHIYLPLHAGNGALPVRLRHDGPRSGSERILLVDDELDLLESNRELLERLGYRVSVTASSNEAFRLFAENPASYDLIITDQTMPGISGAELARKILAINSDQPIILCSGYSAKVSETQAKALGIREFCLKPLDETALSQAVRNALDQPVEP